MSSGTTIKLQGAPTDINYVGRLWATIGEGVDGRVCNIGWTDKNARVACRMLVCDKKKL